MGKENCAFFRIELFYQNIRHGLDSFCPSLLWSHLFSGVSLICMKNTIIKIIFISLKKGKSRQPTYGIVSSAI
jgi:hypothetical protein